MPVDLNDAEAFEFRACGPIMSPLTEDCLWANENDSLEDDMSARELMILMLLASEAYSKDSDAEISFQGMKTKLQLHQQKLTTALKRLQKKHLLDKTLHGYRINKKGIEIINQLLKSPRTSFELNGQEYAGLEIIIPLGNRNNNLFKQVYLLKGRWFAKWRWIGTFQNSCSVKMEWQSLSGDLEACLCINDQRMCIALFDKNSTPKNPNLELLRTEFNQFLSKIQKIMNIDLDTEHSVSTAMIKTHSSCSKAEMTNWLANYA